MDLPTARLQRLRAALDARLSHVACAMESIHQRHNASALLRSCDAFGVHHVHLVEEEFTVATAPSKGAERWLALHEHPSATAAIEALRASGFDLWVADLSDDALPPEAVPLERPICVWLGTELSGVSAEARAAATGIVTVQMRGLAQSLNVSVAGAITLRTLAERARALGPRAFLRPDEREATWAAWLAREEAMGRGIQSRTADPA